MGFMTPAKFCKFTAIVIDTEVDSTLRMFAKTGITHFVDVKTRTIDLGSDFGSVEPSERFYHLANLLARITTLISDLKVIRGGRKELLAVPEIPDNEYLINLEQELKKFEDEVTDFNLEVRYPGYKKEFQKKCTREFCERKFSKIKEQYKWLKSQIKYEK